MVCMVDCRSYFPLCATIYIADRQLSRTPLSGLWDLFFQECVWNKSDLARNGTLYGGQYGGVLVYNLVCVACVI
jgi:hypothetical protein